MKTIVDSLVPRIHHDGWKFILPAVVLGVFAAVWDQSHLFTFCVWFIVIFLFVFFRDPTRFPPDDRNVVVAAADGLIVYIGHAEAPAELRMANADRIRISVFLNLLDVHVNRIPISGTVVRKEYRKGRLWSTAIDKSARLQAPL
jgi:phosphatidylserine decarboxylase